MWIRYGPGTVRKQQLRPPVEDMTRPEHTIKLLADPFDQRALTCAIRAKHCHNEPSWVREAWHYPSHVRDLIPDWHPGPTGKYAHPKPQLQMAKEVAKRAGHAAFSRPSAPARSE